MNTPTPSDVPADRATVVLVDPTASGGETSLDALHDTDTHVLIVVLASGRSCSALLDRARDQGISITSAAWSYLERVAVRVSRPGRVVGTIVAAGPDAAYELTSVVAEHPCERIVLPSSTAQVDRMLHRRLARTSPVPVETAALQPARLSEAG